MTERQRLLQRLQIARAAVLLFRDQGVAETGVDQIADRVGLSVRTVWRYFESKHACVEPYFTLIADTYVTALQRWPVGVSLGDHLLSLHRLPEAGALVDDVREEAIAVSAVRLALTEPSLRAIWLVVYERTERVLAQVIADRLHRSPEDVAVRVQAASLAAALRIATEGFAVAAGTEVGMAPSDAKARQLREIFDAAMHGVMAESV